MRKALPPLVKVLGGMVIGILSLIGSGTLFYLYFHSSSEVPVGIAVAPAPGTTNPPQTATQMATATTVQFDTPLRIWGTRYLVIPIGFPGHQQVSELKSRAGMKEDNTLVNVAIVNEQTDQANLVFDRPMAIGRIDAPRDSLQRHRQLIVYTAHIADSDSNGVINSSDNAVLFISSFDGTGALQITPDSLSVLGYDFTDHDARLRITLAKRPANRSIKPEDWEQVMLWYDLGSRKLSSNKDFDEAIGRVKLIFGK